MVFWSEVYFFLIGEVSADIKAKLTNSRRKYLSYFIPNYLYLYLHRCLQRARLGRAMMRHALVVAIAVRTCTFALHFLALVEGSYEISL